MKIIAWHTGDNGTTCLRIGNKGHKFFSSGKLMAVATTTTGTGNAFNEVLKAVLGIADYLCIGIIIFAGATWMLGNRTKAIEHLIGGSTGYLIIRHAKDIQEFLKGL